PHGARLCNYLRRAVGRRLSQQPYRARSHLPAQRRQDRVAGHPLMATDAHELQGLRALVTGGTKGIGQAIAARLRESGATVLTTARTAPDDSSGVDFVAADVATADGCGRSSRR